MDSSSYDASGHLCEGGGGGGGFWDIQVMYMYRCNDHSNEQAHSCAGEQLSARTRRYFAQESYKLSTQNVQCMYVCVQRYTG